ncbi:MAG: CCA tRNA nucleotidyltransferase [Dehalococcoidia bacterium]|nr:CCA tRNA nucleotidyltransferase [Dehalococcoidia bacterium]
MTNITAHLQKGLSKEQVTFLQNAGAIASRTGTPLFLVGGSVRDLLLGRPMLDLDLVAEGDVAALVAKLAVELNGQVASRSQFDTFKLKTPMGTVDVAAARTETYAQPGALPTVKPGSLADDLARRDFTINALAAHLSPATFGSMVDAHGGEKDLAGKHIRVLHELGFQDDATRMLRAVRYEQRLGFTIEKKTGEWLQRDLQHMNAISPDRLRHELDRCYTEPLPEICLARADHLGVLNAILPGLAWPESLRQAVAGAREKKLGLTPLVFLGLLAWPMPQEMAGALAKRLNLSSRAHKVIRDTMLIKAATPWLNAADLSASGTYKLLKDREPEAVETALLGSDTPVACERLQRFLLEWRKVSPQLSGEKLLAMGVPQGPLVGQLLEELRTLQLDNLGVTVAQEEALVRRRLREFAAQDSPAKAP